jgi:pseudouridine-5'-phosphate glycosidase
VNDHVVIAPDVRAALDRKSAIVGLETGIVSHGMPFPENLTTARALEAVVRGLGAVPATIGVLGGRVRIGLSDGELEHFAQRDSTILKLSTADLPYAVAAGRDGATTVAATITCAHLAGIRVVATGGIGGVHRDAETTLDVSADLTTLGRTPVTVVCSGAKAILSVERTLEALETLGVSVVCYRTDEVPAFWSRSSGIPAPIRLDSIEEIARLIRTKRELGMSSAVIVANPVAEADEIPMQELTSHIDDATREANRQGITGKALTPFLLDWIATSTGTRSLTTNIALVKGNARLGALLALALAERR